MPNLNQISSDQISAEVIVNENFESLEHQAVYGKRHPTTSGLTWGYCGGRWGGFAITAGTVTLTGSSTNYLVVAIATGVLSTSTTTTNWNNDTDYVRVYRITTSSTVVTATEDHRAGPGGVHGGSGGTPGSGASSLFELDDVLQGSPSPAIGDVLTWSGGSPPSARFQAPVAASVAGRHAVPVMAGAMRPSSTGGSSSHAVVASGSNQPDIISLDFDPSVEEYAQFSVPMPKSWNEGTVTFAPIWSHASTTTNFGVVWNLQGVAVSNDDTIAASYGTAQTSTDTGGTTNDLYIGPESSAITIGGTPAAEDVVFFRIARVVANGSDTMAIDARLHGVVLYMTTDASTDA